ncbi:D-sedoheptulose 7-phosphate isomerase [Andreprevotia lacus DSM 23236]|uniref:Phosphoheptose isomerase n=1 Tax=Andreprevotia lacus DSM 23236 TaxID=1121001 RepID=A0A1W1X3L6_9NEIS|nr:D-sedoheptulose 7-phosphate isomerase [Andreprevotia lacus]SMC18502.1 D-sedoheptulose 7-phosphate isomerase [Andreprevotia lacus DSM 23236]
MSRVATHLREAADLLARVLADQVFLDAVEAAADTLVHSFKQGGKAISCGNGGSHCDAMHFAEELSGRYRDDRPALPAMAVSDPSHITCVGNDYGFNEIFARQVAAFGRAGDVLVGITTSGNSANVIRAVEEARVRGMKVVLLMGKDGGKLKGAADVEIIVPHFGYADRIQEIHIKVIHTLIDLIEQGMGYSQPASPN